MNYYNNTQLYSHVSSTSSPIGNLETTQVMHSQNYENTLEQVYLRWKQSWITSLDCNDLNIHGQVLSSFDFSTNPIVYNSSPKFHKTNCSAVVSDLCETRSEKLSLLESSFAWDQLIQDLYSVDRLWKKYYKEKSEILTV